MQLETYISDLLYRYECVTIPEFGAFLTRRVSATIDDTTNTFHAPKKILSFNEQIQQNDGLLARYIADVEKIPFEIANKKIAKRVKILKSYLTQGETLTFKNIGEIVFNKEGKIIFEPAYHLNYLTDSFGLSQFVSPDVTREVYKQDVERIEKVIPIAITPEKRKSKPYLRYAAVALIALTLGGFGASKYYVDQIEQHNQLAQEEATQQLDNKIQQATFSLNPLPAITLNVTKQTGNYHIVAGAFRIKENSTKKVNQLRALGYKARSIGVNKSGLHEVVYGSYETGKEALTAIRIIRKTHNKDAWLKVDRSPSTYPVTEKVAPKGSLTSVNAIKIKEASENAQVSEASSKNAIDLDYSKNPNFVQIIRGIETVENGYYLVLGTYSDTSEKIALIKDLKSSGVTSINSFFHGKSGKHFIYQEKHDDLETAKKSLVADSLYKGKKAIIKVEN